MATKIEDFSSFNQEKKRDYTRPVFKGIVHKELLKNSRCLLTISVGQEVHDSEKFLSTVRLVNKSFKSCIILVDDTLQRHTMALDSQHDADFFYEKSLHAGDQWLQRNSESYGELTILEDVIRWNKWLKHLDYYKQKIKIEQLIMNDSAYRYTFDKTIEAFLHRYYRRLIDKPAFDMDRAHAICMQYIIEECTAMTLWPEINCHFEVYPSMRNLAMAETHKRFVLPDHPDLLHAISIKFKNRGQLNPQQLNG